MSQRGFFDIFKEVAQEVLTEVVKHVDNNQQRQRQPQQQAQQTATQNRPSKTNIFRRKKRKQGLGKDVVNHKEYKKNDHIQFQSEEKDGYYLLNYSFKDHKKKIQTFSIVYEMALMEKMTGQFGFPRDFIGTFTMNAQQKRQWEIERNAALTDGMFLMEKNNLRPNPSSIVSYYTETFCEQIAKQIVFALDKYGMDNRRERIEMAMKFTQDIPYAIPYQNDPDYLFAGVLTPPQIMYLQFGDCDSKAFLFAGILTYLIPPKEIAFLTVPGHLLTIIKEPNPEKGMTCVSHRKQNYVLAETAGPSRNNWGVPSKYKDGKHSIHQLNYTGKNGILPYGSQHNLTEKSYHIFRAPKKPLDKSILPQLEALEKKRTKIKSIVFNDDGGWLILAGKNKFYFHNVPDPLTNNLKQLQDKGIEITDVALNDEDEYVIIYHRGAGFTSSLQATTGKKLMPALNKVTEKQGHPIKDVVFTHHNTVGWVMLYGKGSNGFTCSTTDAMVKSFKGVLKKAVKKGFKSMAFTQKNGWVLIYGSNGYFTYLPKAKRLEMETILKKMQKARVKIDKIYFTATDEWIIVYNGYKFKASFE